MASALSASLVCHCVAALGYTGLSLLAWRKILFAPPAEKITSQRLTLSNRLGQLAPAEAWGLLVLLTVHGIALLSGMFGLPGLHFGFALALSFAAWTGLCFFLVESRWIPIAGMRTLLLPVAAATCVLALLFPSQPLVLHTDSLVFRGHIVIALAAYSVITIAALHAIFMAIVARGLQTMTHDKPERLPVWLRLLAELPPLLTLEQILFRLIRIGFLLLSATLISGIWFSEIRWGAWLRLDHKNVFSLLSWLVFGGLLIGRWRWGWRGRSALHWTLAGFTLLLLSYVGSRFVLEVILRRI